MRKLYKELNMSKKEFGDFIRHLMTPPPKNVTNIKITINTNDKKTKKEKK